MDDNTHFSQALNGARPFFNGSINYENLKRIQKLFFYPVFLFVLPRVRLRDAWCLPEVCEKPCGLWQVQNVLQEPSHGRLLSGRHRVFFFSSQASNSNNLSSKHRCLRWTKRTPRIVLWSAARWRRSVAVRTRLKTWN